MELIIAVLALMALATVITKAWLALFWILVAALFVCVAKGIKNKRKRKEDSKCRTTEFFRGQR